MVRMAPSTSAQRRFTVSTARRVLKSGEKRYFHAVVTPVIACPGRQVIPLVPEFVVPQDGHDKQDCENAAAKRWIEQHGRRYRDLINGTRR